MTPATRRFLACISTCGIAASVFIYIESFSGATINNSWIWAIPLGVGLCVVGIPIRSVEHPSSQSFDWKGFAQGMPRWVVLGNYLLVLVVIAHFVWYYLHGGSGVPTIIDGQYVLNSHGRILKVLTQTEYLTLQEEQLRIAASLIIASYYMPMMYWWFPRASATSSMNTSIMSQ
jgi:hypothetical protein